jgi:glutamyl-tRNA synthetase
VDEVYFQSDRLEIYYKYSEKLLKIGAAYVCTCDPKVFKNLYVSGEACSCRTMNPDIHLERWRMMLDGTYKKGDVVVRIKTDLKHPNPAVRDWPAIRISDATHPRTGNKYRVWPLYNFSCAIDDHEMSISHIIRGKEHEVNTIRQRQLSRHLDWDYPEIINVGRLGLEAGILSKSKIKAGLTNGIYKSWDDPRLGTLRALRRRGLQPESIREIMIQVGPKPINATLSWALISSVNRRNIETRANRYFFVADPVPLHVSNVNRKYSAKLSLHPDYPERGTRRYTINPVGGKVTLMISRNDVDKIFPDQIIRLMGLFNVKIIFEDTEVVMASFDSASHKKARDMEAIFIHWLPQKKGVEAKVIMPDASEKTGIVDPDCLKLQADQMIQFERFGFVRIDSIEPFIAYYGHR